MGDISGVFFIHFDDLKLREQEVGDVKRDGQGVKAWTKVKHVAHVELVDHDIDRTSRRSVEVHLTIAVERVESTVGLTARRFKVGDHILSAFREATEVNVLIAAETGGKSGQRTRTARPPRRRRWTPFVAAPSASCRASVRGSSKVPTMSASLLSIRPPPPSPLS